MWFLDESEVAEILHEIAMEKVFYGEAGSATALDDEDISSIIKAILKVDEENDNYITNYDYFFSNNIKFLGAPQLVDLLDKKSENRTEQDYAKLGKIIFDIAYDNLSSLALDTYNDYLEYSRVGKINEEI